MTATAILVEPFAPRGRVARLTASVRWIPLAGVALLAVLAVLPAVLQWQIAVRHHANWLGVSGIWPMDQLQYLAWIRDAGAHGLIRNLYGDGGRAVFVHPLWTPLALLCTVTGLPDAAGLLLGQLIAGATLLFGIWRMAALALPRLGSAGRTGALIVCVLGGLTPVIGMLWLIDPALAHWWYLAAGCAMLPITALWTYAPLVAAVGLLLLALPRLDAVVEGRRDPRSVGTLAALGALIAWLHPWQGEQLLLIGGGLVLWRGIDAGRRPGLPTRGLAAQATVFAIPAAATLLPLVYYLVLSHVDVGWRTSARVSIAGAAISWPVFACVVLPLVACLLLAVRGRRIAGVDRILFLWPMAVLICIATTPNGQYRALTGAAIPIVLLIARAIFDHPATMRRRLLAGVAILSTLGAGMPFVVGQLAGLASSAQTAYTQLSASDRALVDRAAALAGGRPIIAPGALGTILPAVSDARSWAGHEVWTPDYGGRGLDAVQLVSGTMEDRAGAFAAAHRIAVIVQPCVFQADLRPALRPYGYRREAVGCGHLYVRTPAVR